MALSVVGTIPVLVLAHGEELRGDFWLANPSDTTVIVESATFTATFATGVQSGAIPTSSDFAVAGRGFKRFTFGFSMAPSTAPGSYGANVDLVTSAGTISIPALLFVTEVALVGLAPTARVFTAVEPNATLAGTVLVRNQGNVAFDVGAIPDEPLIEIVAAPRVLAVEAGGALQVEPAEGFTVLASNVSFTNETPTIAVGGWAEVAYELTTPSSLPSNVHLRALPRIGTERFAIDLLTQ